jgi:hypothetical protein
MMNFEFLSGFSTTVGYHAPVGHGEDTQQNQYHSPETQVGMKNEVKWNPRIDIK